MHVSLAEALQVRGGPLQEEEVWAVLNQSAESLHELMRRDPAALGFIISPWSLLLMPSGNISFTDENVTQQNLAAFTSPEMLEGLNLSSLSDVEKMHMYSLGMTLFWGADYEIPQSQPMKLSDHLNSILLKMCEDSTLTRLSVRSVLDLCSTHIRNSTCDPSFSYIRKLVRLVLGSLSQLDGLLSQTEKESLPERSKEIRERLRGKGLPAGRSAAHRVLERYRARTQDQASLNRGLSRSMGSLPTDDGLVTNEILHPVRTPSETSSQLSHQQNFKGQPLDLDHRSRPQHRKKNWASSVDLAYLDPDMLRFGALEDARRGRSALSTHSPGRPKSASGSRRSQYSSFGSLEMKKAHSTSGAYDKLLEKQKKWHALTQAMEEPHHSVRSYQSDYSSSSESPSITSSDPDYRHVRRPDELRRFSSQVGLSETDGGSQRNRMYDTGQEEMFKTELVMSRPEDEVHRLQARLSHASLYPADEPRASINDLREVLRSSMVDLSSLQSRKAKSFFGPEFVKMASEPCVSLNVPAAITNKRGKVEESQRKVYVMLLNGQKLEVSCDVKALCKDVLDMSIAHVGLVEHHLFSLAQLRDNEFFFIDSETKISKVAPDGWKDEPKKRKTDVNFTLFLRIKFFLDDVNFIQHSLTKHQYYLQLRKDILEERLRCDMEHTMLLASLALQAECGDYQPELHGKTYFRLEHYVPAHVLEKLDQSSIKENLSKLHSNYYGIKVDEAEFQFLKESQRLTEYGVHFHRVFPEKRAQTGILMGVYSKGVLIFEVLNGNRTPVLRFPWRETEKISFSKKKICLQNKSDGIKHIFQTDNPKTCQYLLQLCTDQHKFHQHMKTRQNTQEQQELENSPLNILQYPMGAEGLARAISMASLATSAANSTRSNPEIPRRIYNSDEGSFPGFSSSAATTLKSRSHLNLTHVLESPEHRAGQMFVPVHQRTSSETDSIGVDGELESELHNNSTLSSKTLKKDSDSSGEESGPQYGVGSSSFYKVDLSEEVNVDSPSEEQAASPPTSPTNRVGHPLLIPMHLNSLHPKNNTETDSTPPALPPKTRKTKIPEHQRDPEVSDRGDSDMDEDTHSSMQDELMSRKGGSNTSVKHGGIYVKGITPKGAAELDGRIKKGDRVVAVNGKTLDGATHKEAVDVLRDTGQVVHLLLERGQQNAMHAPVTPQVTSLVRDTKHETNAVKKSNTDYNFMTPDNMFEVNLIKNTSGLGFSFSREENIPDEPLGTSMVRVKKLFPGQPAAESGSINVGDVILRVNQTPLKGLTQHEVISALRGTGQEVKLVLCRPEPGVLPDMDSSNQKSQCKEPPPKPKLISKPVSLPVDEAQSQGMVEQALERLLMKSPSRRDSYSDSTDDEGEDEEGDFSPAGLEQANRALGNNIYPSSSLAPGPNGTDAQWEVDKSIRSAYNSANQSVNKSETNWRVSPSSLLSEPKPSPALTEDGALTPPALPSPLNHTLLDQVQKADEYLPEVELQVSLVKSDKGSLGFTLTKGNDQNCYIHDIVQDPAKGDGRLRPGDRMIMVNKTDVSGMSHTDVVNLVRAAPRVVDLVVGRVLEAPKPPIDAHLLPDLNFQCFSDSLGLVLDGGRDSEFGVLYVKDIVPGSVAAADGTLRKLDLIHYINGAPTKEMTLSESRTLLQLSLQELTLKATRDGTPVFPEQDGIPILNSKSSSSPNMNGYIHRNEEDLEAVCPPEEKIIPLQLEKPPSGSLGFSVIGGERGIFVKSITPGGTAQTEGTLQVGDRLLKVNNELMTGVSHTKAVTAIRKTVGMVHLVVSRPPDQTPSTYLGFLPRTNNGNTDVSEDSGMKTRICGSPEVQKPRFPPALPPIDYNTGSAERHSQADESEDTDCDGSSLPEDSPEMSRESEWKEDHADTPKKDGYLHSSSAQDEDELTWGSDELPLDDINSKFTQAGPIITDEELTSLPLVKVVPDGQYTGPKLHSVVKMMRGLLEQKVPLQEFENLQNLQPLDDCLIGQTQENKKKNRYKNIVPFDTTRVTLGKDGGYINANFINMPVKDENFLYIACQGPLPTTLADFWQMVWEQKSNVIAMMTQEVEGGKVKCQRYWPDTPRMAQMVDDRLQVTLVKDQNLDNFIIRLIEIKDVQTNEIQQVTHLNYTGWPDHGTPTQPEQLLTFISYMRHVHQSGPIVTHCSAGIGRSGTLICIDVVLGLISKDTDFDISNVVRTMRLQRQGMVQTEEQYIFCYQVILYVLRCLQAEENISG